MKKCFAVLAVLLCCATTAFAQASYDELAEQADDFAREGQYAQALSAAQSAIKLDAAKYRAYYTLAFVYYKQDQLASAEAQIKSALARVPQAERAKVQKLADAIAGRKIAKAQIAIGDAAMEDGLLAKAAAAYTKAWDAAPADEALGWKAAKLWIERLNNLPEGARILSAIVATPRDAEIARQAQELLKTLEPQLQKLYAQKLAEGQSALAQGEYADAIAAFEVAAAADAKQTEPLLQMARVYAKQNNLAAAIATFKRMIKAGPVDVSKAFLSAPELSILLDNRAFVGYLNDALGPDAVNQARSISEMAAQLNAPRETQTNPKDGAEMIWIPAGKFVMGSDGTGHESPKRLVELDGYWIYKHEVTVGQYRRFCNATGRQMPDEPSWGWIETHPIVNVSWDDAKAYTDWAGVSLPTEAQWEKAARGIDGREYPWGNEFARHRLRCSTAEGGDAKSTAAVGSYSSGASPYGVLDMAGNVWEWCSDWYDDNYYKSAPNRNPTGPISGDKRVLRGGSWDSTFPYVFRAAFRNGYSPDHWYHYFGFRCSAGR